MLFAASRATTVACVLVPLVRLESAALTLTDATGARATLTAKLAPTPSTVTSIVALPAATAVTTPDVETLATPAALLDQTTVRPTSERTLFAASRATTVACVVAPTVRLESVAVTLTDATDGGDTVSPKVAGPTPSTVTPIVLLPAATAVTSPDVETVATPVALLVHTTVRPVSGRMLLAASRATTVACVAVPVVRLESVALTLTDATGTGVTVSRNVAGPTPSTVTPTVLLPAATAVTSPDPETDATPVALLVHTTVRPVSDRMLLAASRATTVACVVVPLVRLESAAVTLTDATAAGATFITKVAGPTRSTMTEMVADPTPTAVIRPVGETVATLLALLDQVTVRPVSGRTLFAASRATTVA
jgi:hypothetical protein